MKLHFDFHDVVVTEFGVGRDQSADRTYVALPIDADVQLAVREIAESTWRTMKAIGEPNQYEPAEKHASVEYLYLAIDDEMATSIRELHASVNLPLDSAALNDLKAIFCYFVRFTDRRGRRLTAVRRATQFKGIVKGRLLRFATNALQLIEDKVFKLDADFDLLADSAAIHILRPSGFEFTGSLQTSILLAVPKNIGVLKKDLDFVDFGIIAAYAERHPRAARYLASIRSQKSAKNIDRTALRRLCAENRVEVTLSKGTLKIAEGHVLDFLEVLDRRRYGVELVKGEPERFRAASRQKL